MAPNIPTALATLNTVLTSEILPCSAASCSAADRPVRSLPI